MLLTVALANAQFLLRVTGLCLPPYSWMWCARHRLTGADALVDCLYGSDPSSPKGCSALVAATPDRPLALYHREC